MRNCNAIFLTLALSLLIIACENKSRQTEPVVCDNLSVLEQHTPDTTSSIQDELPKTETSTSISSSSSHFHNLSSYDIMRGFDPASEDDMGDNGISRYMENNDDKGWD